ncbi:aspartyl-phosphate phosphatase Spo0E family protein [Bacillus sp. V3B]|uniref:Spo0E family sporulation regulatory protein-aspartic acid phosphatase n=1 Tax=Bacillus sp. V3B TaxID=2804915 RepID=UPI0035C7372D|nr:aspartyl-phosphate phosphatase Spo0E family protein [Bacillus sp. V3B]
MILIDELEHRIKQLRNEMIHTATVTGFNSKKTIYISQKLDQLIMIYQKFHIKRN